MEILKIHAAGIAKHGEIDYEAVVNLLRDSTELTFVTHALKLVCRLYVQNGIMSSMKVVRKLNEAKKLESSAHYSADFGKE